MSISEPERLSNRHRDTLLQIFEHPVGHNVEWPAVLSLLEAVGSVDHRDDGKYLVRIGAETEVLTRPRGKDVDVQQVLDLRRMLTGAGYVSLVEEMQAKGKQV
jgi:hypothetical protein